MFLKLIKPDLTNVPDYELKEFIYEYYQKYYAPDLNHFYETCQSYYYHILQADLEDLIDQEYEEELKRREKGL